MVFRPEIFLSATPTELDPYRDAAKEALREMGARAVEHTDLSIPYGPLDGVLNVAIRQCDAVIHISAFAFGPEPSERILGSPRRSFSHYELDIAKALKKNTFLFLALPGTFTNPTPHEDEEAESLQRDHRRAIERSGEHWTFSNPEGLAHTIKSLRPRLMVRRRFTRLPFPAMGPALLGRERPLAELREALETERLIVVRPPATHAASSGSAGKTALAVEAAWQSFEAGRFDYVLWLAGASRVELEAGLAALARNDALSLMQEEITDHHVRLHAVRQWLRAPERENRFLVLIDGVDQEGQWLAVHSILPWLERGTVLITSRLTLAWGKARTVELGAMPVEAASRLLLPQSGREPGHLQRVAVERLAVALGWQPIALRLTALTINALDQTPERFLAELEADASDRTSDSAQNVRWLATLAKVIRRVLATIEPAHVALLKTLVAFAPQPAPIPLGIFSGRADAEKLRAGVAQLDRCGLITLAEGGQSILVHRLVREIVRDRMTPAEQATALDAARALIENAFPRSGRAGASATQRERLVPHCRVVLGQLNGHPLEVHAAKLASGLAAWLRDCGRLSEAEHFQRKALHIVEKACVPTHPELVPELRLLAHILRDQRRYTDAVALHRRAISILEKNPGETRELISELYSLATCLRGAQRLGEAEPALRKALSLEEKSSGPNHPRTAIAAHTLAGLLEVAHRPLEALPLYQRALEIDEGAPLSTPAKVALRLQHLAGALAHCGRRDEAIEVQRRALAMEESAFGRSNSELIGPLKQLAGLLEQERRAKEAEGLYRRALALEEINPAIPPLEIAATLTGLASVLAAQEDFANANAVATRALSLLTNAMTIHPLARALADECKALIKG